MLFNSIYFFLICQFFHFLLTPSLNFIWCLCCYILKLTHWKFFLIIHTYVHSLPIYLQCVFIYWLQFTFSKKNIQEFNLWAEGTLLPRKFRFLKVNGDKRERTEAKNVFGKYRETQVIYVTTTTLSFTGIFNSFY